MANENKRPWYRDPTYLTFIAIIAAALISSSPIWVQILFHSQSDFSVSIDPMFGAFQAGGAIQTTVTVFGIHGYDHTVSLSASGQPSGIVIAFAPPSGKAKPSYTSSVTINVDKNVPARDYTIIIKGIGADGKEHSCSYTLTVKPSVTPTSTLIITPTPTPTLTGTPPPTPRLIIDTMNNTWGWETHREENKSLINMKSIPGRTDNAIEISYDLKEKGCVSIYKKINPERLFGKTGIIFFYKASGGPNTLTIGLEYEDSTQFISSGKAQVTDNWVPVEVPFHLFSCWNDEECKAYGGKLNDLKKVSKITFIIRNCPEQGDVYGPGWVIIDDVQGIAS